MSLSSDNQWEQYSDLDKKSIPKDRNGFSNFDNFNSIQRQNNSFPHAMPQPTGLPWNIQDMSWSLNGPHQGVVEFTATPFDMQTRNKKSNVLHCKRKSDLHPNIPSKQLITEEKMAAYFDGMHISGGYGTSRVSEAECEGGSGMEVEVVSSAERLKGAHRLVLSEEMMRIRSEPIIPDALLQRLEKPCTSLVLWQPPKRLVQGPPDKDPNNNPDDGDGQDSCTKPSTSRRSVLVHCATPPPSNMDMEM